MTLRRTLLSVVALACVICANAHDAAAQLRPGEPLDWRIFDQHTDMLVSVGSNVLWRQEVPLAGARGTLLELGTYRLLWRSGRMGVELSGNALWRFRQDTLLSSPAEGVDEPKQGVRQDAGPLTVAAFVRITPEPWRTELALHFGSRIPTTSDESGLERDRTDFFASVAGRWRHRRFALVGETGVGIHGTRVQEYPQSDVWTYMLRLQQEVAGVSAFAEIAGHQDGHAWKPPVGNADLSELHAGARVGRRWWFQSTYVHGLRGHTPKHGLQLSAGAQLGCRKDCLPFE